MKDFNNQELNVGDKVIFIATDSNRHNLKRGTVARFEKNIGTFCVIKTNANYEYKIKETNKKIIKV